MLKKILTLAGFLCLAGAAHASVTIAANGVANLVLSSSGTTLAAGDLVRLGYFANTANLGTSNSYATLNASTNFFPIGEGIANAGTLTESGTSGGGGTILAINNYGGTQGAFLGSFGNVSATYLAPNTQLYMWVFNSTSASTATQWGIFDAPSWKFPGDPGSTTMSLGSPSVTAIRGTTNGSNFDLANIPASVPEPSAWAGIGSAIVLGCALLRRRRV
jgi:hypothetical protein